MRAAGAILPCAGIALLAMTAGCAPAIDAGVARGSGPTSSAASVAARTEPAGAHAGLLQRLESDDEQARKGALEDVRRMGTRLTPALLERLVGLDSRGAYVAAVSLGALGDRRAVEPLIWVLNNSPSFGVRYAAMWALGRLDDRRAVPVLVRFATTGRDEDVRHRALVSLQQVDETAAVDALARTANDRLPDLSGKAYMRIQDTRDRRAVQALIRALDDPSFGVRYHAELALFEIGDPLALMPLVRIMQDRGRKRAWAELYSREEREWIAEGLGRMGDQRAVPHLVDVLADPDLAVRRSAAAALGRLGDPRAIPSLVGILRDSDRAVREAAEEALGQIGGPEALRALLGRLREQGAVSPRHIRLVGASRDPGALGPLLELLRHGDEGARKAAARAIGQLDLASLVSPLIAAARRGDEKAIAAAFAAPERNGLAGVLALHALLDGPDELARQQAGEALARAGAFTILDAPPIPDAAREAFARGVAELRKGNANFSVSAMFKRAVELAPWWPEARFNYGLVLEGWSARTSAVQEFEAYLGLAPDAANAGDVRARIARLKQPKKPPARGAILDFSTPAELISMVPPRSVKPEIRKPETPPALIAPDRRAD